ncbi:MAG: phage neck terminator protein [Thiobacillus sp.]
MTVDDINKLIRQFVRETLGMPANSVRKANQAAPTGAQNEQFATVLVTMLEPTGEDERKLANEAAPSTNVAETVTGQRRLVASVQFFRGDAYTKACRLKTLMSSSGSIDKLQAVGLGFVRASPARNLTGVIDAGWEERGQIDLEFYLVAKEVQSIPTYGRFPIDVITESSTTSSEVIAP